MTQIEDFRLETREWLEENCPPAMREPMADGEMISGGSKRRSPNPDTYVWLDRMAERGWTAPTWPTAYGGGGLGQEEYVVLLEEMRRISARTPLTGMGLTMIGPTLLDYGTEEQKLRHLPKITSGEIWWCQGYSEPGAGSDLASLQTRAVDNGDHYVINGSKIWTSGANFADWMFCLVRTDPEAPKHQGISFVLFSMDQPGVTVNPILLINGTSPFNQVFLDDVIAKKEDLVHKENQGWSVGKRLLQHERSGMQSLASAGQGGGRARNRGDSSQSLGQLALETLGEENGRVADPTIRDDIVKNQMNGRAFTLTQRRAYQELDEGNTPGAATSIFKFYGAEISKERLEIELRVRGTHGVGWDEDAFSSAEMAATRNWLGSKASSIAGGSNEVQLNIISKRVLELPD